MKSLGDVFRIVKAHETCWFQRVELAYWWLAHSHGGQGDWRYAALCQLAKIYKPADAAERMVVSHPSYAALCEEV